MTAFDTLRSLTEAKERRGVLGDWPAYVKLTDKLIVILGNTSTED